MRLGEGHILVTGATGLIGRNLLVSLSSRGLNARAVVHRRLPVARLPHVEYLTADLTSAGDCARVMHGVDLVFHCAAVVVGAAGAAANPSAAVVETAAIHAHTLEAACEARVKKLLWLGSTTAYPPTGNRPLREEEILDGEPYEKYRAVGAMNRQMEILCRHYSEQPARPLTTLVLRPTNVYGPGDNFDPTTSRVAAALLRRVVEREDPFVVWGTGDDVRDMIYVGDVVRAMVLAMERLDRHTELNIGSGKGYSVKEILEVLLELEGFSPSRVAFDTSKPSMIPIRLVDVRKAQWTLGFVPEIDVREGFRRTLDWYKQNKPVIPYLSDHDVR
jgi:GDP-L-fucose synthase